jgi:hypothetical protein
MTHCKKNITIKIERHVIFSVSLMNFTSSFVNIVTVILFPKTTVRGKYNWVPIVTTMPVISINQNRQQ